MAYPKYEAFLRSNRLMSVDIAPGDTLTCTTNNVYSIRNGSDYVVIDVDPGEAEIEETSPGQYNYVYKKPKVKVRTQYNGEAWLSLKHFRILARNKTIQRKSMTTQAQIGVNRPCIVFSRNADGTINSVSVKFDNMTAAKAYCQEKIVEAVRAKNDYPEFSIYEERFVAKAEEPPVVFV